MLTMRIKKLIVGVTVLAAPAFAMAQSADQLIQKYTPLVGNGLAAAQAQSNAQALVNGLRDGTKITMLVPATSGNATSLLPPPPPGPGLLPPPPPPPPSGPTEVSCQPQTGKMGFGNVDNALTLVQGSLANLDIVVAVTDTTKERPATAADVCAALVGGDVTPKAGAPITLPGILKLRSEGLGWGEISKHPLVGTKL